MNDTEKLDAALKFLDKLANSEMSWFGFEKHPDGSGFVQTDANVNLTTAEVELLTSISKKAPEEAAGPGGLPDDWYEDE